MPQGEVKMKKLIGIALVILSLSGCVCTGTCVAVKEDWDRYWNDPEPGAWEELKQEWIDFWN
jgi:PBP1b-binding outer membrane lipoprotein LpoB